MHQNDKQILIVTFVMLLFVALSAQAFGQVGTTLTGTVQDASQAVLPGATVTATNSSTGVQVKGTTNNAGIYNLAGLQPGTYKVTVEMAGFQTTSKTEVRLDVGTTNRLNFEMKVAGVATQIEISSSVQDMILENSSTTGTVLQEKTISSLPNLNNNMMDLINVLGGVVRNDGDQVFGNSTQTFGGVNAANVNVQRDGITVSDVRFTQAGIVSPGRLNPDMVSEFKMVLTPVDAEMGRGAGQVQVLTKSGTNAFHGSGLWSIMNTGMDANEWSLNKTHSIPNYKNDNEYTLSASGPIIKNKTFFFVTWDQAIIASRSLIRAPVLTNCARKGIFRYFNGWINGNTQTVLSTAANANTRPVVDVNGNPVVPLTNQNGSAYSAPQGATSYQGLQFQSVLGQLTSTSIAQIAADPVNCSQYAAPTVGGANGVVAGSNWDTFRKAYDPSGYISRFSALMPQANDFYLGDGLNTADLKWTRSEHHGADTVYGTGEDNGRKSITTKLDHNLSSKNRLSGTFSYETDLASAAEATWPNGYDGSTARKPITFTVAFTSTLRPTLLNEFRGGLAYNATHNQDAVDGVNAGPMKALLQQLLPASNFANWKGPIVVGPGSGISSFVPDTYSQAGTAGISNPLGSRGDFESTWGDHDYRWTIADTVTWTKGAHSFRGGVESRITRADSDFNGWAQFSYSSNTFPYIQGGNTGVGTSFPIGLGPTTVRPGNTAWTGAVGTDTGTGSTGTYSQGYGLMDYMAGSVSAMRQYYFVNSAQATSWNDPTTTTVRILQANQREWSFFFKDDWKASSSLTLNLGLRWDYFGVPWYNNGLTAGLKGGQLSLFGESTGGFNSWLQSPPANTNNLTVQQFIGPGSPNPNQQAYNKDYTSFGPAVGFAWQLPWFGKGKTTLRGGYQVSYSPIASSDPNGGYGNVVGNVAGTINPVSYSGNSAVNSGYLDLNTIIQNNMLPVGSIPTQGTTLANLTLPFAQLPASGHGGTSSLGLSQYDPNIRNPYIQSITMAVTRNVGSNVTVDVRYIGTLSRKQVGTLALNSVNWLNNGLIQAFTQARAGQDSPLLDKLIPANSLAFGGTGNGTSQLQNSYTTYPSLADGNFAALAGTLSSTNGTLTVPLGVQGALLRATGTPDNFIITNPQYNYANWIGNLDNANYHSVQTQITLRPTHNLNLQGTYTFSRNLGYMGSGTNPLNRSLDYGLLSSSRKHNFSTYGTYTLPLGTNGYLFRDSSKAVKRFVEGWQLSWISYNYSGAPGSITGVSSMWAGGQEDLVRPDLFNASNGHVSWANGDLAGYFYGKNKYMVVNDPQCANTSLVAATQVANCNLYLKAIATVDHLDSNGLPVAGPVVFQHAAPGVKGNYQPDSVLGFGRWGLDMTAGKNFEIMEGKSLNIRIDAQNVFNHPTPSGATPSSYDSRNYVETAPNFAISTTTPFGYLAAKGGHRVFSAKIRLTF